MAGGTRWGAWGALGLYAAAVYALLPVGPRLGLGVLRTPAGAWLLGPGLVVATAVAAVVTTALLRRRGAPWWSYAALAAVAACYVLAFTSLRAARLERTHLPQYGIAAWLAWRAVAPHAGGGLAGYVAAAAVATAIGWGEELVQGLLPNRVYDLRDVALNAAGAVLGAVVVAACRAGPVNAARS